MLIRTLMVEVEAGAIQGGALGMGAFRMAERVGGGVHCAAHAPCDWP